MTTADHRTTRHRRTMAYWVLTAVVAAESGVGGALDVWRQPPFFTIMRELGYPPYFATILGVAKLLAVPALLAPRFPRLKEWAYAGIVFNMTGAVASHVAAGDQASALIAPAAFAGLAVASWTLRPPTRRLPLIDT